MSVLVVGDPLGLALAGAPEPSGPPRLVVALDDAPVAATDAEVLRWWRHAPVGAAAPRERVAAPEGQRLHSRAPWPVRQEIFAIGPPPVSGRVLVVEPSEAGREEAVRSLARRGLDVDAAERLSPEALAAADIVVYGPGIPRALAGDALAVLAAGRLLVTAPGAPAFGLQPDVDHLTAEGIEPAGDLVEAALNDPPAFAAVRRFGRIAAARHEATAVYDRLLADLAPA